MKITENRLFSCTALRVSFVVHGRLLLSYQRDIGDLLVGITSKGVNPNLRLLFADLELLLLKIHLLLNGVELILCNIAAFEGKLGALFLLL